MSAFAEGGVNAFLWKMLIQPKRRAYDVEELGNASFLLYDESHERIDLEIENEDGHKLSCSHFRPFRNRRERLPCVVYVHGHCSSRLDAAPLLAWLLPLRVSVFSFDCSGSGWSGGDYTSLGYHEQKDLRAVLAYLRRCFNVSALAIWGRSSGAVATVCRAADDHGCCAMVLDSPFSDLPQQLRELASSGLLPLPQSWVEPTLDEVRNQVLARAKFDIQDHKPVEKAPQAKTPALFAASQDDILVLPHHTEKLYEAWGCDDKRLAMLQGGHNSPRPAWFMEEAAKFICEHFCLALTGGFDKKIRFGPQVASPQWQGNEPDFWHLHRPPAAAKVGGMLLPEVEESSETSTEMGVRVVPPKIVDLDTICIEPFDVASDTVSENIDAISDDFPASENDDEFHHRPPESKSTPAAAPCEEFFFSIVV